MSAVKFHAPHPRLELIGKPAIAPGALWLAVAALAAVCPAQAGAFSTTRVPTELVFGTLETRSNTEIRGLNDSGQFVGTFGERNWVIWGMPHSFIHGSNDNGPLVGNSNLSPQGFRLGAIPGVLYPDPKYRYLDLAPDTTGSMFNLRVSRPNAINNAGMVVGRLSADDLDRGPSQAFMYDTERRELTVLAVPGATSAEATDINNLGQIVGNFTDASGADRGFLFSGGQYTVINRPGYAAGGTRLGGINDAGTIVGSSYDYGNPFSFIYRNGSFQDFTADNRYTVAADINNAQQIVGWVGVSGTRLGFVYQAGQAVILDYAAVAGGSTWAYTINNLGEVAGTVDGLGFRASVSAVPEPTQVALWLAGLAGVAVSIRQRRLLLPLAT
jgi:probable HAF family extracellular repeat protein